MDNLKEQFLNPPKRYGIYPIIHARITPSTDTETDEKFQTLYQWIKRCDFAGVVGNIPYGANFPDDSDEWARVSDGFRKYIGSEMNTWIYDEKGYPSGTAGGTVLDRHPEYCAQGLYCYEYWRTLSGPCYYRADVPGDKLFAALLLPLDGGEAIDVTDMQDSFGTLRLQIPEGEYHLFTMSIRRLFDGTHAAESFSEPRNYISLSDKAATEEFISVTHEKYAQVLGDKFGNGILAFFTDEPSLISFGIRQLTLPIVPYHHTYPDEFFRRYGYPITLAVSAVVTGRGPQVIKRRCDFWDYIADTVAENYFGTIQDWCHAHHLKSSGHMLWEENLQSHVYTYGSFFRAASRFDWPGIDQLNSEPDRLMKRHEIPIARFLASFADLSGEGESFTECSDHSPKMRNLCIGMPYIYSSVNYHYAMGINNLTSYYDFSRFSESELRELNRYTARIGSMIRMGKRNSNVAVLYPEAAMWASCTPTVKARLQDDNENTQRINDCFAKISWQLLDRQIDFDYIDEAILQQAKIKDGKLCYRDRSYDCVIFPETQVLQIKSVQKAAALLSENIGVIFIGGLPKYTRETGLPTDFAELFEPYKNHPKFTVLENHSGWKLPGRENLPAIPRVITIYPDSVSMVLTGAEGVGGWVDGELLSPSILSHTRILPDGTKIVFLTNMGGVTYTGKLTVVGGYSAEIADPSDGSITPAEYGLTENGLSVKISLKPYEGKFYLISPCL